MTNYIDSSVLCPYYCYTNRHTIICEGLYSSNEIVKGDKVELRLVTKERYTKHMKRYCCDNYVRCPIYRAIVTKYE